jgi:hypothetical protein
MASFSGLVYFSPPTLKLSVYAHDHLDGELLGAGVFLATRLQICLSMHMITWMASFSGLVYFSRMRCSAHAWKSSNTFCLLPSDPAARHSMPYSPPPLQHHRHRTNGTQFALFGMQNRAFGPYLMTNNRILVSVMSGGSRL